MRTRIARYVRVGAALIGVCGLVALGVWARISGPADSVDNSSVASNQRVTGDELLRQAEERLIKRCMERHGFTYTEQPPPSAAAREFPYVVDDVAWANRYGYGHTRERDVNDGTLEKLTPDQQRAWRQTLIGSGDQLTADIPGLGRISAPDNGCTAEARRNLYGDLTKWYGVRRVVDHLDTYLSNKVTGDPRYRAALVPWAKCVRHHGYRVTTPIDLRLLVARTTAQLSARQAQDRKSVV